jgi:hypothetical protein
MLCSKVKKPNINDTTDFLPSIGILKMLFCYKTGYLATRFSITKSHFFQPHFAQFFPEFCTARVIFKVNGMLSERENAIILF